MYEKFEALLKENDTLPYRVSKDTGIPKSTFTAWKYGDYTPKIDKIRIIADYFGVPLSYFYDD